MSDEHINKSAKDDPVGTNKKSKRKKVKRGNLKPKIAKLRIFASFATVNCAVGFAIHGLFSLCFLVGEIFCWANVLRVELQNLGYKHWIARNWSIFLFFMRLLGSYLFWQEYKQTKEPKPSPHFEVEFRTTSSPADNVSLTNSVLQAKVFAPKPDETSGLLLVPIHPGQSNIGLRFSVYNDSPVIAEDVSVRISVPEAWVLEKELGWVQADDKSYIIKPDGFGGFITNNLQSWMCPFPHGVLSGNGMVLPLLTLLNPRIGNTSPFMLSIRGKDAPAQGLHFGMIFLISDVRSKAAVGFTVTTNGTRQSYMFPETSN